jgi:hypothetical protein
MEDVAEEELWISEKRQQLSVPDNNEDIIVDWSAVATKSTATKGFNSQIVEEEMNAHHNLQFERLAAQARHLIEVDIWLCLIYSVIQVVIINSWKCDELKEWLEYKQIQAQDESYRDTKNIHMKYLRHKGFESEFQANRNRLERLEQQANNLFNLVETSSSEEATTSSSDESGQHAQVTGTGIDLIDHQLRAQIKEDISKRISELNKQWDDLQEITKLKGEKLFDANCGILFEQSVYSIDIWIKEMERNIQYTTQRTLSDAGGAKTSVEASDLTTTNLLLD